MPPSLRPVLALDGLAERAARPEEGLHGDVALIEAGDELATHAAEHRARGSEQHEGDNERRHLVAHGEAQQGMIEPIDRVHQPATGAYSPLDRSAG